ncbi:hypothetical protein [Micromonospora inositola]|uniref:hypothetical protein n=1 Tax=Micromonospora inositola TaxID=47865 RepID=UPI001E646FD9|nr:hypothetical protein [Micromonospora inositola]
MAALSGLAYTITPQLDRALYGEQLVVDRVGDQARPLAEQVAAARAAHSDGTLATVALGDGNAREYVAPEAGTPPPVFGSPWGCSSTATNRGRPPSDRANVACCGTSPARGRGCPTPPALCPLGLA